MKEETIEEAAERYWAKQPYNEDAFIEGAKWQQEQDKKCYHPLPYRLAKSDVNYECTLCGKFI
jgi:ribosomal protein S12 methylthiotransferase accessory factor YcaO